LRTSPSTRLGSRERRSFQLLYNLGHCASSSYGECLPTILRDLCVDCWASSCRTVGTPGYGEHDVLPTVHASRSTCTVSVYRSFSSAARHRQSALLLVHRPTPQRIVQASLVQGGLTFCFKARSLNRVRVSRQPGRALRHSSRPVYHSISR
jgi:hypothetical protein